MSHEEKRTAGTGFEGQLEVDKRSTSRGVEMIDGREDRGWDIDWVVI